MEKSRNNTEITASDEGYEITRRGDVSSRSGGKSFKQYSSTAANWRNSTQARNSAAGNSIGTGVFTSQQNILNPENDNPSEGCCGNCCGCSSKTSTQSWWNYLFCSLCNASCCPRREETSNGNSQSPLFFWKLPFCVICFPGKNVLQALARYLDTVLYNIITVFFTLFLLFADSFRILWVPKEADSVYMVLGITCLTFFVVDIYLACLVVPNYFSFKCLCLTPPKQQQSDQNADNILAYEGRCCVKIGSVWFWCDVICLIPLLLGLFHLAHVNVRTINVELDNDDYLTSTIRSCDGMPRVFVTTVGTTVATTARFARFIRVSFVAKFTSKLKFPRLGKPFKQWNVWRCLQKTNNILFGFFGPSDEESRRNEAAYVIQKSWRRSTKESQPYTGTGYGQESSNSLHLISQREESMKNMSIRPQSQNHGSTDSTTSETKTKSQVGSAMRDLTGQRVAVVILVSIMLTSIFTYNEKNCTNFKTMGILHRHTTNPTKLDYGIKVVDAAQKSVVPQLYRYQTKNGVNKDYMPGMNMRSNDILIVNVTVEGDNSNYSVGYFNTQNENREREKLTIFLTLFITVVWFLGVAAFAGPVMYLVVIPIERMISLLTMLMQDPLGYQSTRRYMIFMSEEDQFTQNSGWTKDVLKGMETSFLMSTILRIGSLMKVGFGSAGVDIIRKNLEKGLRKEIAFKNLQGSTVSCVFLFSDIRQFTDATECLQEEVFVFTNKIAEVVHSICNSYGGAANKNIGDAFLVSWALETPKSVDRSNTSSATFEGVRSQLQRRSSPAFANSFLLGQETLVARHHQAEKALLSVVKICIALNNGNFFMECLSDNAQRKLKERRQENPIVQMGFGLHAGTAVQGAIGSQRKIDATYISEAVELSEVLEGLTKRYGVELLMSGQFVSLLPSNIRRKCRNIDKIILNNDDEDDYNMADFAMYPEEDNILELYTYDIDIEAYNIQQPLGNTSNNNSSHTNGNDQDDPSNNRERTFFGYPRSNSSRGRRTRGRGFFPPQNLRPGYRGDSSRSMNPASLDAVSEHQALPGLINDDDHDQINEELFLPSGAILYHPDVWTSDEFRRIRYRFEGAGNNFLSTWDEGLKLYYNREWELAHDIFSSILACHDDGPSQYFLDIIEKNDKNPPRNFNRYGSILQKSF